MDKQAERNLQRTRFIEVRSALPNREHVEAAVQNRVLEWLQQTSVDTVGFYFPVRGEPDLRPAIARWLAMDTRHVAALPAIDGQILTYHTWTEDALLQTGSYGIPVPAHGRPVQPQSVLVPCVAFDHRRFRLGYGGGYYDRTLAALAPRPHIVGVAFDVAKVDSIDPQPHDVQMDLVITEAAQY